jgi:small subunit ribosomal protein S7e
MTDTNITSLRKIKKDKNQTPSELENKVAQAVFDLEVHSKELKADLQSLWIVGATEVNVTKTKKAIVIFVPERQANSWKRIQVRFVRELEKKFAGYHVLVVAKRVALSKPTGLVPRPRKRALASVHQDLLQDVCYPVDIVGQRKRVKVDGSTQYKVQLDTKEKNNFDQKTQTFNVVYRMLTGKHAKYSFDA